MRILPLALVCSLPLYSCSSGSGGDTSAATQFSPTRSSVSLNATGPVPGDGVAGAEVEVVVRDESGAPVANAPVDFSSSDSATDFWPAAQRTTKADGSCTVMVTRAEPGTTLVDIGVGGTPLGNRPTVQFVSPVGPRARVSVASDGTQANDDSEAPSISADGEVVAFQSDASNLIAGDNNQQQDVFVHVLATGATEWVSKRPDGAQFTDSSGHPSISDDGLLVAFQASNQGENEGIYLHDRTSGITTAITGPLGLTDPCFEPAISGDGRYIAFACDQSNDQQVWVVDRMAMTLELVSQSTAGAKGDDASEEPSISRDGRYIAFTSDAENLVSGDTNDNDDVFLRDRQNGTTVRVSTDSNGAQVQGDSDEPAIAADGRYVAFTSDASGLVTGDNNGLGDVFRKDLQTGQVIRISVDATGQELSRASETPSISADGNFVAFVSDSGDLVANDDNGEEDVFVREIAAGVTRRVTKGLGSQSPDDESDECALAADAAVVAFASDADNLVRGDTNDETDVFVGPRN